MYSYVCMQNEQIGPVFLVTFKELVIPPPPPNNYGNTFF